MLREGILRFIMCNLRQKLSFETLQRVKNRPKNFYLYIRGWIGGSGALTVSAGITLVYVVGAVTTWRVACIICGAIPVLVAITMPFLPETPNWLIANNKKEDAYKVNRLCVTYIDFNVKFLLYYKLLVLMLEYNPFRRSDGFEAKTMTFTEK